MADKLTICDVRLQDIDTLLLIEQVSHTHPWTHDNFATSIAANYPCWALKNGRGELCAYTVLMSAVDELHILNMTVAAPYRRCGYARYLLDAARNLAGQHQIPRLLLEVRVSNIAAIACYTQYGFQEIGRRRGYYAAADMQREDALVMTYSLHV